MSARKCSTCFMCVYAVFTCVYIYIYTYIHTYIHSFINTYMYYARTHRFAQRAGVCRLSS